MKTRIEIDEAIVKKFNEEQIDWTAVCRICKMTITGSLADLRAHKANCHGK